jgi:Fe2+ transport system protein FeoA
MLLYDLKVGQRGKISAIEVNRKTLKRLNDLGLCVGTQVSVVRFSPFLDPIEIKVRDFYLAIRKNVAKKIVLEII